MTGTHRDLSADTNVHDAGHHPHRRDREPRRPVTDWLLGHLDGSDRASLGRGLLIVVGVIVAVGAPLLTPLARAWWVLGAVSVVMIGALALSYFADWSRLPARASLFHPLLVMLALAVLGLSEPGRFAPLTGALVLCFAYIGLTQRLGTSLLMATPAAVVLLIDYGSPTIAVLVRLPIAIMIFVVLGELLSLMTVRQEMLADALQRAAHSDALTGLANRRDWNIRLAVAAPGDSVVVVDLDHFKRINDTHGHTTGDEVLADFGAVLRVSLRAEDYCARLGGEEFGILLHGTVDTEVSSALTRLRERWSQVRPEVTFSAGYAACRTDRLSQATFSAADVALYEAKRDGRNTDRGELPADRTPTAIPVNAYAG